LRELGDLDHLGKIGVIWQSETLETRTNVWRMAIRSGLPEEYRDVRLDGGTAT
jgi:hypothetical protein